VSRSTIWAQTGLHERFATGCPERVQWQNVCKNAETLRMEWETPDFEEVCLSCEINTYASAEF